MYDDFFWINGTCMDDMFDVINPVASIRRNGDRNRNNGLSSASQSNSDDRKIELKERTCISNLGYGVYDRDEEIE